jgi:uncharacterized protein (TIGR03382 family)
MAKTYLLALLCALAASPVSAALVSFSWTSEVDGSIPPTIPGVSVGEEVTVVVTADNGNSTLASQQWFINHVLSATVTIGSSYSATFINSTSIPNDFIPPGAQSVFQTDGSSTLIAARFQGTGPMAITDTFDTSGTGTGRLYNNSITASNDTDATFVEHFYIGQTVFEGWDTTPDIVPEPSALCLALAGVALLVRRRSH